MQTGVEIWTREDLRVGMCLSYLEEQSIGGAVNWMSKRQYVVELSTIEVEYMVATHVSKEKVWLQRLCSSMGLVQ